MAEFVNQEWWLLMRLRIKCNVCKLRMYKLIRMGMRLIKRRLLSAKYMTVREMLLMTLKQLVSIISQTKMEIHS
jgi:hypothetical protein